MNAPRMKIANLNQEQLSKLQAFEQELGAIVVALEPHDQLANLSSGQLQRVESMEQELGVVLLAYEKI